MGLKEDLKEVIAEMDRVHPEGTLDFQSWRTDDSFPNFVTSRSGVERHFTKKAQASLHKVAETIHANSCHISSVVELDNFEKRIRQCVADLHADDELAATTDADLESSRQNVMAWIDSDISQMNKAFTHYFPAWTLGLERDGPFAIGPVTFFTREQWIDSVEYSAYLQNNYLGQRDANVCWKELLKRALTATPPVSKPEGLAGELFASLKDCPSVLKVTIQGYEKDLSRKVAEIVCKAALDSISLIFGGGDFFHQQALREERLQPISSTRIIETDGQLWLPGTRNGPRLLRHSFERLTEHWGERRDQIGAVARILGALVEPAALPHPNLSKRWATALDWLADGCREKNDAVALTKIATSLDVLACGGKYPGILRLLVHVTNVNESTIVVTGTLTRTLSQVVKDIYDNGRSQILHGTHFDRLKSFAIQRGQAAHLARIALIESAIRLADFNGDDGDKEFRNM